MPYSAEISRVNPACFLFLIDQSGSMSDPFGGGGEAEAGLKKADGVADVINKLLQNLVLRCAKEEGVRDYFHVGVIGYGATAHPAFGGALEGREMVPISEIGNTPVRIEERAKKVYDGAGGLVEQQVRYPIWFDSAAKGGTPMCQAFGLAKKILETWLAQHPDCFPPIVLNITDGESTDGDPSELAEGIKRLKSSDGEVLLFNCHVSALAGAAIQYPEIEPDTPDKFALLLYRMSSPLTPSMVGQAKQSGLSARDGSRGYVFNADIVELIKFLDIGTRPSDLR